MKLINIFVCIMCFQRGGCDFSFLKGRWKPTSDKEANSYFQLKGESIYAVSEDAKVSMDIKNFKKKGNLFQLEMENLKIHSKPVYLNIFDFKVIRFIRQLMSHGMMLEFLTLPNATIVVKWTIHERKKNKTLQHGRVYLSKEHYICEDV